MLSPPVPAFGVRDLPSAFKKVPWLNSRFPLDNTAAARTASPMVEGRHGGSEVIRLPTALPLPVCRWLSFAQRKSSAARVSPPFAPRSICVSAVSSFIVAKATFSAKHVNIYFAMHLDFESAKHYSLGMETTPKTLTEAIRYYSDAQTCINAVAMLRWQDGSPVCPNVRCDSGRAQSLLAGRSEAVEVLLLPQAIQRQGRNDLRGFARLAWTYG